jgi:hypothetical protein
MSNERASIFDEDTAADLDVSSFAPRSPAKRPVTDKEALRAAAEQRGFASREPERVVSAAEVPAPAARPPRKTRQHLTGRNRQFNVKATAETIDRFYAISDAQNWVLGETLEHALAALERELAER